MQSVGMLKAVISGETYEVVAARFGKSRTAVERRINLNPAVTLPS
jgi:biotin operon repressor